MSATLTRGRSLGRSRCIKRLEGAIFSLGRAAAKHRVESKDVGHWWTLRHCYTKVKLDGTPSGVISKMQSSRVRNGPPNKLFLPIKLRDRSWEVGLSSVSGFARYALRC